MNLIQEIADALNITFYEAAGLLILVVFVLLCIIYQCCVKPCIDCLKCVRDLVCCIPNMCYKCLLNPCWDSCFSKKKDIYGERVPLTKEYADGSVV